MLPNLLTASRLVLTPFVIYAILSGKHALALALFIAAGVTDFLDGAAARHFNSKSDTGAYLDPIADKCLLSGVYLALALAGLMPWWLVGLIFGRDIYILLAAGILLWRTNIRRFPPSVWGKISTFVQIVTATLWLARNVLGITESNGVWSITLWTCAVSTAWSGIHYTWRGLQVFESK
jgi:cardiolipin synthase